MTRQRHINEGMRKKQSNKQTATVWPAVMNSNLPTGGTPEPGDVATGLSEAVMKAEAGKKNIPPIDAGTAAVDYAVQQRESAPASVVHVDFGGDARKSTGKAEAAEDPEVAQAVEALRAGRLGYRFAKRAFDIVFSALVLICLSWLFLIIAVLIKLDDPKGPVLFKQRRVGMTRDGKLTYFDMYKFRSMCVDAEARLAALRGLNEKTGPVFKIAEDPRITRVGKWLRKLSLDELPQFFNVLMGDISIVGPRPALPLEVATYNARQRQRLQVKPGITCYWQTRRNRDSITFDEWVELDLLYIKQCSAWADFKLIVQTVGVVLTAQGN